MVNDDTKISKDPEWKRPVDAPLTNEYARFTRAGTNGVARNFTIVDLPEDMYDFCVEQMVENFLIQEPMCSSAGVLSDETSTQEARDFWKIIVSKRMSIVCFELNKDGSYTKDNYVGCNVLYVGSTAEDSAVKVEFKGKPWTKVYDACVHAYKIGISQVPIQSKYYLGAFGLLVLKKYQGMKIGTEILKSRGNVMKKFDIPVTITIFTNIASQKNASGAGFETSYDVAYEDFPQTNPDWTFNIKSTKSAKVMYLLKPNV